MLSKKLLIGLVGLACVFATGIAVYELRQSNESLTTIITDIEEVVATYIPESASDTATTTIKQSMLMKMMEDAPYEESQFRIKTTIETGYIVERATIYLYTPGNETIRTVVEDYDVKSNTIDHSFFNLLSSESYAVIHLVYGPNFLFDRYSEAVCIVPFIETNIFDPFHCDPLTTSEYLIAASMVKASKADLFTPSVAKEALYVKRLPRTITYEYYLAIHQMLLAHVAETDGYLKASQDGEYLYSMLALSQEINLQIKKLRRLNVGLLDKAAESIDSSMVNLTYRIYMTLDGLLDRHTSRLSRLSENNQLITDFYTGITPFLLAGAETDVIVSVEYDDDIMRLNYWPWFSGIKVKFNSSEETFVTTDRVLTIPADATFVDIQGQSLTGRYPTMRFAISQKRNFERGLMSNANTASDETVTIDGVSESILEGVDAVVR